jgi:hypothetical protein
MITEQDIETCVKVHDKAAQAFVKFSVAFDKAIPKEHHKALQMIDHLDDTVVSRHAVTFKCSWVRHGDLEREEYVLPSACLLDGFDFEALAKARVEMAVAAITAEKEEDEKERREKELRTLRDLKAKYPDA